MMIAFTLRTSTSRQATARARKGQISFCSRLHRRIASADNTHRDLRISGDLIAPKMHVSLATPPLVEPTYPGDTDYRVVRHSCVGHGSGEESEDFLFLWWFIRWMCGKGRRSRVVRRVGRDLMRFVRGRLPFKVASVRLNFR
jgi:hypothetical protein